MTKVIRCQAIPVRPCEFKESAPVGILRLLRAGPKTWRTRLLSHALLVTVGVVQGATENVLTHNECCFSHTSPRPELLMVGRQ